MLPYAVSALRGLREELPRMAEYHERAVEMAELLATKEIRTFPERPHCNACPLFRRGTRRRGDGTGPLLSSGRFAQFRPLESAGFGPQTGLS
jgi:hypothetical protein